MAIFMTGATGFIGSHLASHLIESGQQVHAYVRNPEKVPDLAARGVRLFAGELDDKKAIVRAMEGCTFGYHLAAFAKVWDREQATFERINYGGGINVMEAAVEVGLQKLVLTSTGGVIGPSTGSPAHEGQSGHHDGMTAYERSKARLEQAVPGYIDRGLEVVIVNPARVFGPGLLSDSNSEVKLIRSYVNGRFRFVPGDGHARASYCDVEDVVHGHIAAMERGRCGERYLLGGDNVSYREFFDLVGQLSGKRYRLFGVPIPLLLGFAKFQVWMARNFGRYPLITPELVRKYAQDWSFSSDKARRELGYEPRPLDQTIQRTIDWLRS